MSSMSSACALEGEGEKVVDVYSLKDTKKCIHYVQPETKKGESPILQTVRAISMALFFSSDWEETSYRSLLWAMYTALFVRDIPYIPKLVSKVELLGTNLQLMTEADVGLALFTERDHQVNVHIIVPRMEVLYNEMYSLVVLSLEKHFSDYAINMRPLAPALSIVPSIVLHIRRFLSSARNIPSLTLCMDTMCVHLLGESVPVVDVITDLRSMPPLCFPVTRYDQQEEARDLRGSTEPILYWHRFPCGTIASFLNTVVDVKKSIPYPCVEKDDVVRPEDTLCGDLYAYTAMLRGERDYLIHTIGLSWIPIQYREVVVHVVCIVYGVTDKVLKECHHHFSKVYFSTLLKEILLMKDLVDLCASEYSMDLVGERIACLMMGFINKRVWEKWALTSPFLLYIFSSVSPDTVDFMTKRYPFLVCTLGVVLFDRIGKWNSKEFNKSALVTRFRSKDLQERIDKGIHYRLNRVALERNTILKKMEDDAERAGEEFMNKEEDQRGKNTLSVTKRDKKIHRKKKCKGGLARKKTLFSVAEDDHEMIERDTFSSVCVSSEEMMVRKGTMHSLVEELSRLLAPHRVDLIGSGLFIDSSDADIVVTVKDEDDYSACYEIVKEKTGWTPLFNSVTGDRVVILRGKFKDVQVDAQVWRGEDTTCTLTKAEEMTREALRLSHSLDENVDESGRVCIRDLHDWFSSSEMKGHALCRLPGIGVTCASVTLHSCCVVSSLKQQLFYLCDCLQRQTPSLDFDSLTYNGLNSSFEKERCVLPVHVNVLGCNCAFRMTTLTTRHLVDTLAFAISLRDDDLVRAELYRAWRRESMVVSARVIPISYHFALQTLFSVVSSMDTHPFIESLHLEEEQCAVDGLLHVKVLCTIQSDDSSRYGFQTGDTVLPADEDNVLIKRAGKKGYFFLCLSPQSSSCTFDDSFPPSKTNDMILFTDSTSKARRSFPNLPFLTQDVLSKFDTRAWRADVPCLV